MNDFDSLVKVTKCIKYVIFSSGWTCFLTIWETNSNASVTRQLCNSCNYKKIFMNIPFLTEQYLERFFKLRILGRSTLCYCSQIIFEKSTPNKIIFWKVHFDQEYINICGSAYSIFNYDFQRSTSNSSNQIIFGNYNYELYIVQINVRLLFYYDLWILKIFFNFLCS